MLSIIRKFTAFGEEKFNHCMYNSITNHHRTRYTCQTTVPSSRWAVENGFHDLTVHVDALRAHATIAGYVTRACATCTAPFRMSRGLRTSATSRRAAVKLANLDATAHQHATFDQIFC
ncbi:hypothetical protein ACLOJK_011476 [Asimina triloba]